MGAPPLPPVTATLDELAVRGPLHVCRDGQVVELAVPEGVEQWVRLDSYRDGAREYRFFSFKAPPSSTPASPKTIVAEAKRKASAPLVHHKVWRGAAFNPSCTPALADMGEDAWTEVLSQVTCGECLFLAAQPPAVAPSHVPIKRTLGHLGLVDLEALEPMRVDPDGDRATHHDSTEEESP